MRIQVLILILVFISSIGTAQETIQDSLISKKVFTYRSLNDFKSGNHKYIGHLQNFAWSSWGKNVLYVVNNSNEVKVNVNDYWGFKIGDVVFRNKKSNPKIPLTIMGIKEKVFYLNGYFYLGKILGGSSSSSRSSDGLFYSDNLNSKIFSIDKIVSKAKNNSDLAEFVTCIKKGKKRYGYQAQFNSYSKCVKNHLSE